MVTIKLYKKGEIFNAEFEVEQINSSLLQGFRPYVILQEVKETHTHVLVAPLSKNIIHDKKSYTCLVKHHNMSILHLEQMFPVNINDVTEIVGKLRASDIKKFQSALIYIYGLDWLILGGIEKLNWKREQDKEYLTGYMRTGNETVFFRIPEQEYYFIFGHRKKGKVSTNLKTVKGMKLIIEHSDIESRI